MRFAPKKWKNLASYFRLPNSVLSPGLSPEAAIFFPSRHNLVGATFLCSVESLTPSSSCKCGSAGRAGAAAVGDAPAGSRWQRGARG